MKNDGKRKPRSLFKRETNHVDMATGEIVSKEQYFVREVSRDEFIKFYVDNTGVLLGLKDHELRLVLALLQHMKYDNVIYMTKETKTVIAKGMDLSIQRISDTVTSLVKKKAIYRMSNGHYTMNPDLFFKGDDLNRIELFKRIMEIKITDKKDVQS